MCFELKWRVAYTVVFGSFALPIRVSHRGPALLLLQLDLALHDLICFDFYFVSTSTSLIKLALRFHINHQVWCSTYGLDLEPFIGFILTAYVFCIGVLSVYTGLVKSVKLEKLRKEVIKQGPERVNSMAPSSGFHYGSFNEFSLQMTNHMTPKVQFTEEEYGYIAGALSFKVNTDGVIDPAEFRSWTIGSMTIL